MSKFWGKFSLDPTQWGWSITRYATLTFKATNNEIKYETIIIGLHLAWEVGAASLRVKCDSQLVVKHIKGLYQAKDEMLKKYLTEATNLIRGIHDVEIQSLLWEENQEVDALSEYAFGVSLWKEVHMNQVDYQMGDATWEKCNDLMTPIKWFLQDGEVPKKEF